MAHERNRTTEEQDATEEDQEEDDADDASDATPLLLPRWIFNSFHNDVVRNCNAIT